MVGRNKKCSCAAIDTQEGLNLFAKTLLQAW